MNVFRLLVTSENLWLNKLIQIIYLFVFVTLLLTSSSLPENAGSALSRVG